MMTMGKSDRKNLMVGQVFTFPAAFFNLHIIPHSAI
ncbi:hypothetical protein H206_05279 [Candidatus Electrothrix aarhusensis]|uniref:Uncharacterized protein n=1 Tax=Candidatus Electrothrix aarhusensis TaxID=1859131 RepID=A0A444J512_9BACT|nr:hypothetical protein H206_05279 [Candidatus Electrothrix aarhusensis]